MIFFGEILQTYLFLQYMDDGKTKQTSRRQRLLNVLGLLNFSQKIQGEIKMYLGLDHVHNEFPLAQNFMANKSVSSLQYEEKNMCSFCWYQEIFCMQFWTLVSMVLSCTVFFYLETNDCQLTTVFGISVRTMANLLTLRFKVNFKSTDFV